MTTDRAAVVPPEQPLSKVSANVPIARTPPIRLDTVFPPEISCSLVLAHAANQTFQKVMQRRNTGSRRPARTSPTTLRLLGITRYRTVGSPATRAESVRR